MCEIFHIREGATVKDEHLWNAACNNWHSWGMAVKIPGKKELLVIRSVPDNSDALPGNPQCGGVHLELPRIKELLAENIKYERVLHFRFSTRGAIDIDNCHPFTASKDKKRHVEFFHNGLFTNVVSAFNPQDTERPSDTKEFVDRYLRPQLTRFVQGDYTDPIFLKYIWEPLYKDKGQSSRCLFMSTDKPTMRVGTWNEYKDEKGEIAYFVSAPDYVERLSRGPVFYKQEEEVRRRTAENLQAREAEAAKGLAQRAAGTSMTTRNGANGNLTGDIDNLKVVLREYDRRAFQQDPVIIRGIEHIFRTLGDGLDGVDLMQLVKVTDDEWEECIQKFVDEGHAAVIAYFISIILDEYCDLYDQLEESEDKHEKATKTIASYAVALKKYKDLEASMNKEEREKPKKVG